MAQAQVYEDDIPLVALGQTVEATVDAVPGKTFSGPITFIYPHLDHMTRTAMVRVALDNPNHELSPGMYATANIMTSPYRTRFGFRAKRSLTPARGKSRLS